MLNSKDFLVNNGYLIRCMSHEKEIVIPNTVRIIGREAFSYHKEHVKIIIPDTVTKIEFEAFLNCINLKDIVFSKNISFIGGYAFENTAWYNNQKDDLVYVGKILYKCKENSHHTKKIKKGTISVADYAFKGCKNITGITIPDGVETIGDQAFFDCSGIKKISIPDSVTSIGFDAFDGCSSLKKIIVGRNCPLDRIHGYGLKLNTIIKHF